MKTSIGKYGITGSTGLGVSGFFHVSAPYDCNGKVFVEWEYVSTLTNNETPEVKIEKWDGWKRMTMKRALKENRKIILCCQCNEPAVSLDHFYPYMSNRNFCQKHHEAMVKSFLAMERVPVRT